MDTFGSELGVEVTRATFVNLSVIKNFDFEKVYVWFFESCSYLSPHLSCGDIYEMLMRYSTGNQYFLHTIKKGEISQTEKKWLVTPTMDLFLYYIWEPEMYCCDVLCVLLWFSTGPLFTKWTDILPQDLTKPRSLGYDNFQCCQWWQIVPDVSIYYMSNINELPDGILFHWFCKCTPPWMFLPLDIPSQYWPEHVTFGLLCVRFKFPSRIFCRRVPGFATDCPCGVWCRGLTTCLLYVGPPLEF